MNQNQQKGSGDAAETRQYQYEEQKESKQQSVPNRTFQFSFGGKQDIPKKLKMPRSMNYIEAVQAADLLTANDEAIIAKLKENMDEDAVDELSEMSAEELAKELMRSIREELSDTLNEMKAAMFMRLRVRARSLNISMRGFRYRTDWIRAAESFISIRNAQASRSIQTIVLWSIMTAP